jgi:hypothetical protein
MILVTAKGFTRSGPLLYISCWVRSMLMAPPSPVPSKSPTLSGFFSRNRQALASSRASLDEARPICTKRSVRCATFRSIKSLGSKAVHSAAILTSKSSGSKSVIGPTPLSLAKSELQNAFRPTAMGLTIPTPVT